MRLAFKAGYNSDAYEEAQIERRSGPIAFLSPKRTIRT
jgi:hypothetical protein